MNDGILVLWILLFLASFILISLHAPAPWVTAIVVSTFGTGYYIGKHHDGL